MKKLLVILLCLIVSLGTVACSSGLENDLDVADNEDQTDYSNTKDDISSNEIISNNTEKDISSGDEITWLGRRKLVIDKDALNKYGDGYYVDYSFFNSSEEVRNFYDEFKTFTLYWSETIDYKFREYESFMKNADTLHDYIECSDRTQEMREYTTRWASEVSYLETYIADIPITREMNLLLAASKTTSGEYRNFFDMASLDLDNISYMIDESRKDNTDSEYIYGTKFGISELKRAFDNNERIKKQIEEIENIERQ